MRSPIRDTAFSRRAFLASLAAGAGGLALERIGLGSEATAGQRLPNFVVIFTDDQGYQDLGCFGSPNIKTPRIDKMAAEGMKFTDFYVSAPVCTPSRASLLTGCYAQRVSLPAVLFPNAKVGINPEETTLAELLRDRGYATCCIGKWHLGHLPPFLPTRNGFDRYFGIPYSNDMRPTPLLRDETPIEEPADQATLTERYTEEAVKFIEINRHRPFFLYLPHTMPHVPLFVSERFKDKSAAGLYGDVIECIDWSTGQILDAIAKLGLDGNTLVIFVSDNGPWLGKGKNGGCALPLRDGKFSTYEGGMRVPCVMRWPGRIPAGKVCSELATTLDILPTFARLAGAEPPKDRIIDGKDIWPLMSGAEGAKTPHEAFFYYRGYNLDAVRSGKWKLHFAHKVGGGKGKPPREVPAVLYDLDADIGEKTDVAAANPDVVKRLEALGERMREDLGDSRQGRPGKNRRPCGKV